VNKNKLINKFNKNIKKFTNTIPFDKLQTIIINLTNLYIRQGILVEIM